MANETKATAAEKAVPTTKVEHKSVYAALSAFQGELKPIEQSANVQFKTKAGESVNFNYTPLGKIMEVIYPILARHGLSVRHELTEKSVEAILTHETTEEKAETLVSTTSHFEQKEAEGWKEPVKEENRYEVVRSNELRSGKLMIDMTKADMKEVGAQITYARRYTIGLVLGLATEEDKDASLLEDTKKNVTAFAFNQAKSNIEKASGENLDKQIQFLKKELELAQAMVAGTGTKAPSIGLAVEQYEELLALGQKRGEVLLSQDTGGQE